MGQPLPFFLDLIAADITADFAARSNPALVFVGQWEGFKLRAEPRIVLGLGDGDGQDIGQGANHYGPGNQFPTGTGTVARPLWANAWRVLLTAWGVPDKTLAPALRAESARAAAWGLTNATLAAMWRSHGGTFPWGGLHPLNEDQGAATYGAAFQLWAQFSIPVLDDDYQVLSASEVGTTTLLDLGGTPISDTSSTAP